LSAAYSALRERAAEVTTITPRFADEIQEIVGSIVNQINLHYKKTANAVKATFTGQDEIHWATYRGQAGEEGAARLGRQLANFHVIFDRDLRVEDEQTVRQRLIGRLVLRGIEHDFSIDRSDFFDNRSLLSAIGTAAGAEARVLVPAHQLRDAISWLNYHGGRWQPPTRQSSTTRFGWNDRGDQFLVPSGRITAAGFIPASEEDPFRVDLTGEEWAGHLDLLDPHAGPPLAELHRHIVDDLLHLHHPRLTYSLLGVTALAVLDRFAPGDGKFVLWIVGPTGTSKSFTARRFQHFFWRFPRAWDRELDVNAQPH
jgi:hypothetical protein